MDTQDPNSQADAAIPTPCCQWCSTPVSSSAASCPGCGASLEEAEPARGAAIPGVTVVDPDVVLAERKAAQARARARTGAVAQVDRIEAISGTKTTRGRGWLRTAFGLVKGVPDDDGGAMFGLLGRVELARPKPPVPPKPDRPSAIDPTLPGASEAASGNGGGTANDPWRDLPPASLQEREPGTE